MPIDVHAHYVPASLLERLEREGARFGISMVETEPACRVVRFGYGVTLRPFFAKLTEEPSRRLASMDTAGIDRQLLSTWCDVFGYGLDKSHGVAWHRALNETLGAFAQQHPSRFSLLASAFLPDAAAAARELEHAVKTLGAVGAIVSSNVEGANLGELPLDEFWAAAVELGTPVFVHPTQPNPTTRTRAYGLNTIAQYTFDTTLAVGTLIGAGVLDRFPGLKLILAHGGGTFPYLAGRFDCMFERTRVTTASPPSAYLGRLFYDTLLHDASALRYLTSRVGLERLVIGTDDGFPPADYTPLESLRRAGFSADDVRRIADDNPRALFARAL